MIANWKKYIFEETALGLEIVFKFDKDIDFKIVKSSIKKDKVELVEKLEGFSLEEVCKTEMSKKLPLFVTFSGKGVIQKKVSAELEISETQIVHKVLLNTKISDFYFQIIRINDNECWVTIVRKNLIDPILKILREYGFHIYGIDLGLMSISKITDLLSNQTIKVNDDIVSINDGVIEVESETSYTYSNTVTLGDEIIDVKWLPAFSSTLSYFGVYDKTQDNFKIEEDKLEFKQHVYFSLGVKFLLVFFLLLLLVNFFLFQSYSERNSQLTAQLEKNSKLVKELSDLNQEYTQNQLFFKTTGLVSSSRNSYFIDNLASSKPIGIYWNQFIINPPLKKIQNNEEVKFQIGTIEIVGYADNSIVLSQWMQILEQEKWIKTIDIKDYQKHEKKKGSSFHVQIKF